LQFPERKVQISETKDMNAQKFNFATKFAQNGLPAQSFVFFGRQIYDKKKIFSQAKM